MTIQPEAGLVVSWPRTEPVVAWWMEKSPQEQRQEMEEDLRTIDRFFDEAEAFVAAADRDAGATHDLRFEAMRDVLAGRTPVLVRASSAGQIESAVAWGVRRNLRLIVVGGHMADRVADLLKRHDVPVIIAGLHRLPTARHSPYDEIFTLPLRLHQAGVRFCIASGAEPAHERNLNHVAASSAAYGLPRSEALRSVTLSAAEILGVGATLGSLEAGKSATLIVTTGDPLEIMTDTLVAFIDGRRIDLGSRHKGLHQKYREKYLQMGILPRER
jgi:imidazolonepropionase-like amidohydrolase